MSDLTNELRDEANGALAFGEHGHAAMLNKAADRIDALEECVRELIASCDYAVAQYIRPDDFEPWHNHWSARMYGPTNRARALLEGK